MLDPISAEVVKIVFRNSVIMLKARLTLMIKFVVSVVPATRVLIFAIPGTEHMHLVSMVRACRTYYCCCRCCCRCFYCYCDSD